MLYIVYLWGGLQHFGAYNPFSVLNTLPSSFLLKSTACRQGSNSEPDGFPSLVRTNQQLPTTTTSKPPKRVDRPHPAAVEMGCVVLRRDPSCMSQPNPIFTACLYIPAANGLHTEARSRPKSAGSSVQLGQGGNLVISPLHRRLMNLKLR